MILALIVLGIIGLLLVFLVTVSQWSQNAGSNPVPANPTPVHAKPQGDASTQPQSTTPPPEGAATDRARRSRFWGALMVASGLLFVGLILQITGRILGPTPAGMLGPNSWILGNGIGPEGVHRLPVPAGYLPVGLNPSTLKFRVASTENRPREAFRRFADALTKNLLPHSTCTVSADGSIQLEVQRSATDRIWQFRLQAESDGTLGDDSEWRRWQISLSSVGVLTSADDVANYAREANRQIRDVWDALVDRAETLTKDKEFEESIEFTP